MKQQNMNWKLQSSAILRRVVSQLLTDVSKVLTASTMREIALMMEAVITFKTSVNFYETKQCNVPENCCLHTRRHENLKSHQQEMRHMNHPPHHYYNVCLK
jgi:hypothetical protein